MSRMQFLKNSPTIRQKTNISPRAIILLTVSATVAFLLFLSVFNVSKKYFDIRNNIEKLENEKSELESKRANLKEINERINSPDGIEQSLRDKYNVVKPGEGIIIVTGVSKLADAGEEKSRISKWWDDILHGIGIRKD
jgi:cell division protein FtsB